MIEVDMESRGLAARLAVRAAAVARAAAETRLRARRADPARWRKARLLWPQFTQDHPGDR